MTAGSTGRRNILYFDGKDGALDETSRVFSRLHCGRETRGFGNASFSVGAAE
jgi:hypothetical protein